MRLGVKLDFGGVESFLEIGNFFNSPISLLIIGKTLNLASDSIKVSTKD